MNNMDQSAIEAIARLLADYRHGEIPPIDAAQVVRWAGQFPPSARSVMLRALARALPRVYLTQQHVRSFCAKLLKSKNVWGADPLAAIARSSFMRLQEPGHSQQALLAVFEALLRENAAFGVNDCWEVDRRFVYLDDACLSGRTLIKTLTPWLRFSARPGDTLLVILVVAGTAGLTHACRELCPFANAKGVTLRFVRSYVLDDGMQGDGPLFSASELAVITPALHQAGQQMLANCANAQPKLLPLGYCQTAATWTQTLFCSWRNIPNNGPLALWWGRPDWPGTTLARWTPLIPRNVGRKEPADVRLAA